MSSESRKTPPHNHQQKVSRLRPRESAPWPSEREGSGAEWAEAARKQSQQRREEKSPRGKSASRSAEREGSGQDWRESTRDRDRTHREAGRPSYGR